MAAKALLVLTGVLMVAVLLVSTEVSAAAAGAEERQQVTEDAAAVAGADRYAPGCRHGCCKWLYARCVRCCPAPETMDTAAVGGVGESKQRRCRCCWFYLGRCQRYCCNNGEVFDVDMEVEAEPHN
uniref:CYC02 protein n=1 Tax=Anthurium amnicola TaxID=1678845 RepID=A0A1D1YSA9_9ARAE